MTDLTGLSTDKDTEIRDLFIDRPGEDLVGLFGIIGEGARVENIGMVTADVSGNEMVGGLESRHCEQLLCHR